MFRNKVSDRVKQRGAVQNYKFWITRDESSSAIVSSAEGKRTELFSEKSSRCRDWSFAAKKNARTRQRTLNQLVAPKFNPNLIVRAYVDNLSNGSAKSGAGDRQLPAAFFFAHASARFAAPIGEPILSGEYPQMDSNWDFWMSSTNPNSHRLTH